MISPSDTAWILVCSAMVLLMTPALAFFYGGLVRSKNALNTMMMRVACGHPRSPPGLPGRSSIALSARRVEPAVLACGFAARGLASASPESGRPD